MQNTKPARFECQNGPPWQHSHGLTTEQKFPPISSKTTMSNSPPGLPVKCILKMSTKGQAALDDQHERVPKQKNDGCTSDAPPSKKACCAHQTGLGDNEAVKSLTTSTPSTRHPTREDSPDEDNNHEKTWELSPELLSSPEDKLRNVTVKIKSHSAH